MTTLDGSNAVGGAAVVLEGATATRSQLTVSATHSTQPTTGIRVDQSAVATLDGVRVTGFDKERRVERERDTDHRPLEDRWQLERAGGRRPLRGGGRLQREPGNVRRLQHHFRKHGTPRRRNYNQGYLNLLYSTISGTSATTENGGGIYLPRDYLETAHCTVAFNGAPNGVGGGVYVDPSIKENVHVNSSIIASNTARATATDYSGLLRDELTLAVDPDVLGSLSGVTAGESAGDIAGAPMLGPLSDNGGPTQTCAILLPSSPAVDASLDFSATSTTDQRGFSAPVGCAFDFGAFEWRASAPDARSP